MIFLIEYHADSVFLAKTSKKFSTAEVIKNEKINNRNIGFNLHIVDDRMHAKTAASTKQSIIAGK